MNSTCLASQTRCTSFFFLTTVEVFSHLYPGRHTLYPGTFPYPLPLRFLSSSLDPPVFFFNLCPSLLRASPKISPNLPVIHQYGCALLLASLCPQSPSNSRKRVVKSWVRNHQVESFRSWVIHPNASRCLEHRFRSSYPRMVTWFFRSRLWWLRCKVFSGSDRTLRDPW